jgi:hypothetical protein
MPLKAKEGMRSHLFSSDHQCEYDPARLDLPCAFCSQHGMGHTCVKTPAPSQLNHGQPGTQAATSASKLSEWLLAYEQRYPGATFEDCLSYLNSRPWQPKPQVSTTATTILPANYSGNYFTTGFASVEGTYPFQG